VLLIDNEHFIFQNSEYSVGFLTKNGHFAREFAKRWQYCLLIAKSKTWQSDLLPAPAT
jgi:hypothetical protein